MMDIEVQIKELLEKAIAKINDYGSRILQEPIYEEGEERPPEGPDLHAENLELRLLCNEVSARLRDHFESASMEEKKVFLPSDQLGDCSESCSSEAPA